MTDSEIRAPPFLYRTAFDSKRGGRPFFQPIILRKATFLAFHWIAYCVDFSESQLRF